MRKPILALFIALLATLGFAHSTNVGEATASAADIAEATYSEVELAFFQAQHDAFEAQQLTTYLNAVHAENVAVQKYLHHLWVESLPKIPAVLQAIARCESVNGKYTFRDHPWPDHKSSATGKYGFLDGTWRSNRPPEAAGFPRSYMAPEWMQDQAALTLYKKSGTGPWRASAGCWG